MSDTPKNDDTSEFRDPTAPSEPDRPASESTPDVTWSGEQPDDTQRIEHGQTEQFPGTPPGGSAAPPSAGSVPPPSTSAAGPSYGTPPGQPPSPYAQQGPYGQSQPQSPYLQSSPQSPYGQRPPGSPYSQGPAGGPPPPPYGGQPPQPGYGYGPGPYAAPRSTNGSALALTIVSGVSLALGACLTAIPALILGIMALAKQGTSPADSAKYARWGWIAYAIGVVLYILAIIGIIALIATTASQDGMMRY